MHPRSTLEAFDRYLLGRGLALEAVVIGGSALSLLGVISRQTRDCDILAPMLTPEITLAARAFAVGMRANGDVLRDDWLNNGPSSLGRILPTGWEHRVQEVFRGQVVVLQTLHRSDLLKSKLFALCDRGFDLSDCLAMAPTAHELTEAGPWVERQDLNPGWPAHVQDTLADLGKRLGHVS